MVVSWGLLNTGQCFSSEWKHMLHLFFPQSLDPSKRIGCEEMGGYDPLRRHPFFDIISWSDLHLQTPPKLTPYLPAMSEDDEDCYGNVRYLIMIHPFLGPLLASLKMGGLILCCEIDDEQMAKNYNIFSFEIAVR